MNVAELIEALRRHPMDASVVLALGTSEADNFTVETDGPRYVVLSGEWDDE